MYRLVLEKASETKSTVNQAPAIYLLSFIQILYILNTPGMNMCIISSS